VTGIPSVEEFLDELRSKIGVTEHPLGSNHQEFSTFLQRPDQFWCADFLVASSRRTGLVLPNESASTPVLAEGFKDIGRFGTRPARGAFGFVFHRSKKRIAHTFAVEAVNQDGSFGTIEGNTDVAGGRTGGKVCRHRRTMVPAHSSHVVGFGYPSYAKTLAARRMTFVRPPGVPRWWTHPTKLGDVAQEVASVCVRLKVPKRVTFDEDLQERVRHVQQAHHLHDNGVVDAATAKAIG
jgi:hypothetical protein